MAINPHKITAEFEAAVAEYTNSPYAVAIDNCSNALFLALMWWRETLGNGVEEVIIPARTYPSVPCEIIHAGMKVKFVKAPSEYLSGPYRLYPTNVFDCALRFTSGMYVAGQIQCLSFTGPHKHLKLGKAGMILTDDEQAYRWFKRARFSGRRECSYHDDKFDMLGWNFYLSPEVSARGLLLMIQFYDKYGKPKENKDLTLPYPDLSEYKIYSNAGHL